MITTSQRRIRIRFTRQRIAPGFLFVELLVGIVVLTIIALVLSQYQWHTLLQYHEVRQQALALQKASDVMEAVLVNKNLKQSSSTDKDGITITWKKKPANIMLNNFNLAPAKQFCMVEVAAAWQSKSGKSMRCALISSMEEL